MATFTVDTLADELYDGGNLADESADGGGLSLREALALTNANPGADTITFAPALTGGTTAGVDDGVIALGGTELVITNDVTINGDVNGDNVADITVSGSGASRVFNIDDGLASAITANLNGLVIRDGFYAVDGGAIRVANDALIVTNSTITENVAQRQGGAIINFGSITLTNTILSGNQSTYDGGAIMSLGTAHITNTTLSGNHADGSGGAVANYGPNAELNLTNTTVSGNFADGGGGGIVNAHGSAALINTTVVGNEADRGGGIYNFASTLPSTLTLTNSTVSGNLAGYTGGGIQSSNFNATTTLTNTIVAGNQAVLYGTIFDGHDVQTAGTLTLTGGNVVGDTRTIDGANPQSGIALTDIFASVTNNPDTGVFSGTLASNGGPVQTIALNEAASNPALDAGDDGLAPATDARGFSRDDVAGAANNGANVSDLGAFEASHSLVVTTLADTVDATDGLLSLREALALANGNADADTITFDPTLTGGVDPGVDDGHLLLTNGELAIASDVTIDGDVDGDGRADIGLDADLNSRVIHVTGGVSTLNALVITGGSVYGIDNGAGILIDQTAALTVNNSTVAGNYADAAGGGIHNDGLLTLNNVLIAANTAASGGGVDNSATGIANLTNTTVYGNYASDVGGGMVNDGTATLTHVTITGNATDAGGIGGGAANSGDLTLTNSIIAGNDAPIDADYSDLGTTTTNGTNLFSQAGVGDAGDIAGADIADIFRDTGTVLFSGADGGLLNDNGGPTPTAAIKTGGLAHDAPGTVVPVDTTDADGNGNSAESLPIDARGFARDVDGIDIGAVELQHGTTYTVDTLDDEEYDGGDLGTETADGGGLSLREALALTNADPLSADTIQFDSGLVGGTLTLVHGVLEVLGDTEITGDVAGGTDRDITIDAVGASRVFTIISGTATLNGLTMTGGDATCGCDPGYGGAVSIGSYLYGGYANVTISNSTVSNSAAYYGGGISVDTGSSLRLINSTVSGSEADIGGGIAVNADAALTTINTTISDNHAAGLSGYGGGIAINNGGASATLINTTISGNTAYSGGGIYNGGALTLINVTLANNSATYGGGLYSTPCGCATMDVFNSTITGNVAEVFGGGIYHYAGTLNLTDSIVAGNGAGYAGPDIIALDTVNYSGKNVFSQGGVGRGGIDIYAPDTATIFASVALVDPSPADGDEFQAGLLANNGGPVQTVAIRFGGDAYNTGDNTALPDDTEDLDGDTHSDDELPFDARGLGFARVALGNVDIGAFEIQTSLVNSAPVNTVPGTQEIDANTAAAIAGLSVADADAGGASITTTLAVNHGTLSVTSAGGAGVSGSGTSSVTLTGSVAQINTTLTAAGNVVYTGAHDFFGPDTLTVLTNDGGNTGTGGPLTDSDSVAINVNTLTIGTPGPDAYEALRGQEMFVGLGGTDTITFNFRLVDAQVSYEGNKVIIDGPSTHTVLTGFEVFVFTDGTVHNDDGSPLIDDLFYYSKYHDVWDAHVDADAHYNTFGWHEGRDPDAFFSTAVYLSLNPDVRAAGVNPLVHFDLNGWTEGRVLLAFDPARYLAANPDVAAAHVDPLRHFFEFGASEGRQPFGFTELLTTNGFDYVYYLQHNPDVAAAGTDPFQHFQTVGWKEGRNPNALFDVNGYLANYPDVAAANINPLDHYNQSGWHEGRDPSPSFDTTSYLAAYPDVAAAHVNPLIHFLQFGIHEGRSPFADGIWG